jgi:hypothetical protein
MGKRTVFNKKKPYIPMRISRVKLNPEQAVLSCCINSLKGSYAYAEGYPFWQCATGDCAYGADGAYASSISS